MNCPKCGGEAEESKKNVITGDLDCCGRRHAGYMDCNQIGHKNYICKKCYSGLVWIEKARVVQK